MLTPLGKVIRKLRLEKGWLLKDMASGIGVAPSFLSAVETGKKSASNDLLVKIKRWANPTAAEWGELNAAWAQTRNDFTIRLRGDANTSTREAAAMLARSFDRLTEEQVTEIQEIVKRKTGDG